MSKRKTSLHIPQLKPRNPLHMELLSKKAGFHERTEKAKRTREKVRTQKLGRGDSAEFFVFLSPYYFFNAML